MPWFFKVSSGWSPYSLEQSKELECSYEGFLAGVKDHAVLGETWRVDFERMLQYRSGDPGRQRAVKREEAINGTEAIPPQLGLASTTVGVSSSSTDSANAVAVKMPAQKRLRLLDVLTTASNEELTQGLDVAELSRLSELLQGLATFVASKTMTDIVGNRTSEPSLLWLQSDFKLTHGRGKYGSPLNIRTARLMARIGIQPVMFWVRSAEVVLAESEEVAWKLTTLVGSDGEGVLLFPPPPYDVTEDVEHKAEELWMPLSDMKALKDRCGLHADPRPANAWLKSVFVALVQVMHQQHGADLKDSNFFESCEEMLAERFEEKYLPSKVMNTTDMLKERGVI